MCPPLGTDGHRHDGGVRVSAELDQRGLRVGEVVVDLVALADQAEVLGALLGGFTVALPALAAAPFSVR